MCQVGPPKIIATNATFFWRSGKKGVLYPLRLLGFTTSHDSRRYSYGARIVRWLCPPLAHPTFVANNEAMQDHRAGGAVAAGAGEGLTVGTRIAVKWDHGWEEGTVTAVRIDNTSKLRMCMYTITNS